MSTVNPFYTMLYSQPEEYRFSHDSVFLARRAFEILKKQPVRKGLDLCAGCGIVGMDFLWHRQNEGENLPESFDFLEVQDVYQTHFIKNISQIDFLKSYHYLPMNYDQVFSRSNLKNRYDLILCNPPYFENGTGAFSPSEFKNRCRFFIDSTFEKLLLAVQYLLSVEGQAFVFLKNADEQKISASFPQMKFSRLEKIRETDLFKIEVAGY